MLSTALQVANEFLSFVPANEKYTAVVYGRESRVDDKEIPERHSVTA